MNLEEKIENAFEDFATNESINLIEAITVICQQEIDEACKNQRDETIEECAMSIENNAEKANDVLVEDRHILAQDTVELFRNDIEYQRLIARKLRELKNAPSPKESE